jgi:hypothetical protein
LAWVDLSLIFYVAEGSDMNAPTQQLPNYNNMYQNDTTPLVGAATPGMDNFEPMAANSVLGGGFGASW